MIGQNSIASGYPPLYCPWTSVPRWRVFHLEASAVGEKRGGCSWQGAWMEAVISSRWAQALKSEIWNKFKILGDNLYMCQPPPLVMNGGCQYTIVEENIEGAKASDLERCFQKFSKKACGGGFPSLVACYTPPQQHTYFLLALHHHCLQCTIRSYVVQQGLWVKSSSRSRHLAVLLELQTDTVIGEENARPQGYMWNLISLIS